MKEILRRGFRLLGFRVTRDRPANRFQAMDEAFLLMRKFGYRPRLVIDGGANRGQFFRLARPIFSEAEFHLIEPQPACREDLEQIVAREKNVHYPPTVVTEPGD